MTRLAESTAPCPECGTRHHVLPDEVDRSLICVRCDTSFHVAREVRRRRVPGRLRSGSLEEHAAGPDGFDRRSALIGALVVAGLALGALVVLALVKLV